MSQSTSEGFEMLRGLESWQGGRRVVHHVVLAAVPSRIFPQRRRICFCAAWVLSFFCFVLHR